MIMGTYQLADELVIKLEHVGFGTTYLLLGVAHTNLASSYS